MLEVEESINRVTEDVKEAQRALAACRRHEHSDGFCAHEEQIALGSVLPARSIFSSSVTERKPGSRGNRAVVCFPVLEICMQKDEDHHGK